LWLPARLNQTRQKPRLIVIRNETLDWNVALISANDQIAVSQGKEIDDRKLNS
jgi:hypothetical protein